ncbi:MAG: hypothetical protein M3P82_06695, partial [Bacteroidota bacterium]|nr:hypothetical protein [Bacteroidota bacterium]
MSKNLSATFKNDSFKIKLSNESINESILDSRPESETRAHTLWSKFIELLSDNLKVSEVNTWFSVITPKNFENNILTITVPSEDYYSLIESRYNKVISKIVDTILGPDGKLNYEITQMGLFSNADIEKASPRKETFSTPPHIIDFTPLKNVYDGVRVN